MKITVVLMILCVSSLFASEINSQNARVNISMSDVEIKTILNEIERQTEYLFLFVPGEVNVEKKVTVKASGQAVSEVLDKMFSHTGITYAQEGSNIFLMKEEIHSTVSPQNPIRIVQGTVLDEHGIPIIGANIFIKGSNTGVISDMDGQFAIEVDPDAILTVSYIGYLTQNIAVKNSLSLVITLIEDTKNLDEIVVVGYGTQKKVTLTGSVAAVKGDDIVKSPSANMANALTGRLPGLIINNRTGEPGVESIDIRVRGTGTTGNKDPLIIIDGVERGGLGFLNPNDIESITVLKDASAAIYGSRAANGVILVTTKRGTTSKPTIQFSYNQGFSQPTRKPRMADSYTFAQVTNEIEAAEGRNPRYTTEELTKFRDGSDPDYPSTNWYDEMIRKATPQHRTNISISGGNERVNYYLSFGELSQSGQYKNGSHKFNQYTLRSNVDVKITNDLTVGMNLSGRYDDRHAPYWNQFELNSHMFLYQPDWNLYWPGTDYLVPNRDNESIRNWVNDDAGYVDEKTIVAETTMFVRWAIPYIKGLTVEGSGSFDPGNVFTKTFQTPTYVYYKDEATGELNKGLSGKGPSLSNLRDKNYRVTQFYLTAKINYERSFKQHNVGALVGYEQTKIRTNTLEAYRSDFLSTSIPQLNLGSSDKNKQENSGSAGQDARQNVFSRFSYDYAGKYMVQVTMRVDGSPKFPKDKRYGFFPGFSAGWRISEENFMKKYEFLDNLKIRGSYGVMGNDRVNDFQYLMTYGFDRNYVIGNNDVSGLVQSNVPNPLITWETAKTWNIGLETSILNGLLSYEFDFFHSRRSDILTTRTAVIPEYTGLKLPAENIGIVDNKGFEMVLTHQKRINDFQYSISGNVSFARNKVVFSDEQPAAEEYQYATGRPYGSRLMYNAIGIFKDQAHVDSYPHMAGAQPGDIIYEDVNGDGEINSLDRIRINHTNVPEIVFGLNATFAWKGFDFSFLLQGQENAKQIFNSWFPAMSYSFGNFLQWRADGRWTPENTNATMPRGSYEVMNNNSQHESTQWLISSGFLRMKNMELGYSLPHATCEKLKIQGLRFSVSGTNLFIIYDHMGKLGFDPETDGFWFYSPQRVYNIGVNVTF